MTSRAAAAVEAVVAQALAKDPGQRFASADLQVDATHGLHLRRAAQSDDITVFFIRDERSE